MLGAIFIYLYFSMIKPQKHLKLIKKISDATFTIYLVHAGFIDVISKVLKSIHLDIITFNPLFYIPTMVIFIFIISYLFSSLLNRTIQYIKTKIKAS
jgi:surface polysaccharide O-acyltransferase-like enzyme